MFQILSKWLVSFRSCFNREKTFYWFVAITFAFIIRGDTLGMTSVVRTLCLLPSQYYNIRNFFHNSNWSLESIRFHWYRLVADSGFLCSINRRVLIIGDGTKVLKEGFKMVGVKKIHQESENSSKGEYIYGHMFGAVGAYISCGNMSFCIPLRMSIQDGLKSAAAWTNSPIPSSSHVVQMIENGFEIAKGIGQPIYYALDRYFLSVPALTRWIELSLEEGSVPVHIVTRAKKDCRPYLSPPPRVPGKSGRPPKKGDPVVLWDYFKCPELFTTAYLTVYGKANQEVRYFSTDLLWGKKLYVKLRFVLTIYNNKLTILVCTDLNATPTQIIEMYSKRSKIECSFREGKQQFDIFGYHFWMKALEKLDHFAKSNAPDNLSKLTDLDDQALALTKIRATERFVLLQCIAMGMVQLLALSVSSDDIKLMQKLRYTRTVTAGKVSEATVRSYLADHFWAFMSFAPRSPLVRIINSLKRADDWADCA